MTDGPKRISTEPTLVIDVDKALSERAKAAIQKAAESYPELPAALADEPDDVALPLASPEELAEMLRAKHQHERRNAVTQVPCPACNCSYCGNERMVPPLRAAEIAEAIRKGDS